MRIYTVHLRAGRPPVLVREGLAWWALLFGPFWLLAHRAWIPGVLGLCASIAARLLLPAPFAGPVALTLAWAFGLFGNDLRRWSLDRAGYLLANVIAAPDQDAALARLLDRRPDLIADAVGLGVAA
jgi:hypothetical protein